jgi:dihydroxy-acid dehydratase
VSQTTTERPTGAAFDEANTDGMILRMFMRGAGYSAGLVRRRPVIGIANSWSELNPCNGSLRELAGAVKRGVLAAGGWPLEFPTISLGEPFVRPTTLFLRNLMAMDVEEMISASPVDGVVLLGGCDKTIPAQLMGAVSAGKPAITLAAGPRPGARWGDRTLTIDDLWPMADERRRGALDDDAWGALEGCLNGGFGTCNVMGTATTMAIVAETLGMALPGSALLEASGAARRAAAEATGERAVALARAGLPPSALVTPTTLENAFRVVVAVGGSTNAVLHLEALAGRVGHRIGVKRLGELSSTTPLLADVRPFGTHLLADLQAAGGVPAVVRELTPVFATDALAGDGNPWSVAAAQAPMAASAALRPFTDPSATAGGLVPLSGTLAPDGAVIKRAGAEARLWRHRGRAIVFEGLNDLHARIDDPALRADADSVLVLRGVGPVGGPGMPEVGAIPIPAPLLREGVRDMVRISDGRMSGTARGAVVLHVAPEAAVGGPLALVADGDEIELDLERGRLDLLVDDAELARRRVLLPARTPPPRGFELLHELHVVQANEGCDFDFLRTPASVAGA